MARPKKAPNSSAKAEKVGKSKAPKAIGSTRSLSAFVKSICDILRRSNCASAMQYVPELTWVLFLRILDEQDKKELAKSEAVVDTHRAALKSPYRWQDWAAPYAKDEEALKTHPRTEEGKPYGWKRQELFEKGDGALFEFINTELLPHLHSLDIDRVTKQPNYNTTPKQRVIGRIMTAAGRGRAHCGHGRSLREIFTKGTARARRSSGMFCAARKRAGSIGRRCCGGAAPGAGTCAASGA